MFCSVNLCSTLSRARIVINKTNPKDIIINSVKGLEILTPNANNLPFQVCWSKNKKFIYRRISEKIHLFLECLRKCKSSWKENFMLHMKDLDADI